MPAHIKAKDKRFPHGLKVSTNDEKQKVYWIATCPGTPDRQIISTSTVAARNLAKWILDNTKEAS